MTAFVDTSVLVRYLTNDNPELAERAARILDSSEQLVMPEVVLAETAYVLTSFYGAPRHVTVDTLVDLVQKRNVSVGGLEKETVVEALWLCRPSGRVSFADALVWAAARGSAEKRIYALDDRFPSEHVQVLTGPPHA